MRRGLYLISLSVLACFGLQAQSEKALFYAIFDSDYSAVQQALQDGADINALYRYERYREECTGWSVAHVASAMGNLKILKLLNARGADLQARVSAGSEDQSNAFALASTLHIAAAYGNLEIVQYLLDNGLEVNAMSSALQTPLLSAIVNSTRQNLDVLRLLIDRGAEIQPNEGRSPLFEAVWEGKAEVAKLLLDRGAKASTLIKDARLGLPHSVNPMYAAIYKHHNRLLQLLFDYGSGVQTDLPTSLLHWAVLCDNTYAAAFLLQRGSKADIENAQGQTPLSLAKASKASKRMVKLLENGRLDDLERQMYEALLSDKFKGFNLHERPAPNFELRDLNNQTVILENYRGRVVVLNVWATWCPPCLRELPSLKKMLDKLRRSDVLVAAVSIDSRVEKVMDYVAKNRYPFTFLHDPSDELRKRYEGVVPSTYIIDKEGRIIASIDGSVDWSNEEYVQFIRLLARLDGTW